MALIDEILATGLPLENHGEIAEALSVGRIRVVSRSIGIGSVLDALGPGEGAAVLDTLNALTASSSVIKWAWHLLDTGTLDVGNASTRAQLDALAGAGAITSEQAAAIKALAEVPDVVTWQQVAAAIEGAA